MSQVYPPCAKRREGADLHPCCDDPTKPIFHVPVRPIECCRCLGLPEPEPDPSEPIPLSRPPRPRLHKTTPPPVSVAPADPPPEPPGIVKRAASYAEAVAQWIAFGRPVRSDKDVERIFHQHCKTCNWFDPDKQVCRGCGCRVADNGYAVLNKIKMATENCPRELW